MTFHRNCVPQNASRARSIYAFTKAPGPPPPDLRRQRLSALPEPQEQYLEGMVSAGAVWLVDDAYAVVTGDAIVEFFVAPARAADAVVLFESLVEATGVSSVYCQSFDRQLMFVALSRPVTVTAHGLCFRRIVDASFTALKDLTFRPGTAQDIETILDFDDGFFDSAEEVASFADNDGLVVLENPQEVVGCGIAAPVIDGRDDVDVGMLVAPEFRRRGYGAHIIGYLKDRCLKRGERPICGCSIDNLGSAKALANAGFVCEHRVLWIEPARE